MGPIKSIHIMVVFVREEDRKMHVCIEFIDFIEYLDWLAMPVTGMEVLHLDLAVSIISNKIQSVV